LLFLFSQSVCLHVLPEQENGLFLLSTMCENWPCRFSVFFVYQFRFVSISQRFLRKHTQTHRCSHRTHGCFLLLSIFLLSFALLFTPRSAISEVESKTVNIGYGRNKRGKWKIFPWYLCSVPKTFFKMKKILKRRKNLTKTTKNILKGENLRLNYSKPVGTFPWICKNQLKIRVFLL